MLFALIAILAVVLVLLARNLFYTPPLPIPVGPNITADEQFESLERWLQMLHESRRFSGTVLIGDAEQILFTRSHGFEDLEQNKPLPGNSSFNLASVSKHFTAAAIVLLEQDGTLSVDDLMSKYLPELSFYPAMTIRHLLHHTSGIPDYMQLAIKHGADKRLFKTSDLIALYRETQPAPDFEPGERFRYSNTGYVLLAEIVARASGQPFEDFMRRRLFEPAGMSNTQVFNLLSATAPSDRVFGFKRNWLFNRDRVTAHDLNNFDGVAGDGGVYASALDLYAWHRALHSGSVIPRPVYDKAYETGRLNDGTATGYGYGWFLTDNNRVEHAGGWVGFSSYLYRDLATGHVIIILDNGSNTFRIGSVGFRFNSIALNLQALLKQLPQ